MKEKTKPHPTQNFCKNCGAVMIHKDHCVVCGAQKGKKEAQSSAASNAESEATTPTQLYRQRRFPRHLSALLVVILLVASLGVAAFEYLTFQQLNSVYNTDQSIVYQQDNGLLKINLTSWDQSFVLDKYYNNNTDNLKIEDSHDNRFIAYLSNQNKFDHGVKGNLILMDLTSLSEKKNTSNAQKILVFDQEVVDFKFTPESDGLVFLTVDGQLYHCDYSKLAGLIPTAQTFTLTPLDSKVSGLISIGRNALLYYKGGLFNADVLAQNSSEEKGFSFDLYWTDFDKNQTPSLIDTEVYNISSNTEDFSNIIYTKKSSDSKNSYTVFLYNAQAEQQTTLLVDHIDYLVESNASDGSALYLTSSKFPHSLSDFFDDDLLVADRVLQNPNDLDELPEGIESTADERYQTMVSEYSAKLKRDLLRKKLTLLFSQVDNTAHFSYDFFYLKNPASEAVLVSENILGFDEKKNAVFSQLQTGNALFVSSAEKPPIQAKISEMTEAQISTILDSEYTIQQLISEGLSESLMFFSADSASASLVYTEKGDRVIANYSIASDKSELFFFSKERLSSNIGILYSASITNESVAELVYIDEYVYDIIGYFQGETPGLIYQTASKDDLPEFIIYDYYSSNIMQVATKTNAANYSQILGNKKDRIYYFRNYDEEIGYGNLYVFQTGEDFIASEISQYQLLSNNELMLLQKEADSLNLIHLKDGHLKTIDHGIKNYYSFDHAFYP